MLQLQMISILNKCYYFELFIYQSITVPTAILSSKIWFQYWW